eukprot:1084117-Pelagomonas_calceolata.AAC.1
MGTITLDYKGDIQPDSQADQPAAGLSRPTLRAHLPICSLALIGKRGAHAGMLEGMDRIE